MGKRLPISPSIPGGCTTCAFHRRACQGLEQLSFFGCFDACETCGWETGACDYVCPRKPYFWRAWAEVGGLDPRPARPLTDLANTLPRYVPMIRHGSSRCRALRDEFVALNTFDVVGKGGALRGATRPSLRCGFGLRADARILLVSVNSDPHVESLWHNIDADLLARIASLGVLGATTPNFSLFDDAPRIHSVRNLWRILRCAEKFAHAGIRPIVHVNAICRDDWIWWSRALRDSPAVRYVCKEFQTGLRDPERIMEALTGLRTLQDSLAREIHPIIVGGRRVAHLLPQWFKAFTIVDSVPFIATTKRKMLNIRDGRVIETDNPTLPSETLDRLLSSNLQAYRELVDLCTETDSVRVPEALDDEEHDWDATRHHS